VVTTPFSGMWKVLSGDCAMVDGCIQSPNYPESYGDNQHCIIAINDTVAKPISVEAFSTESWYDYLTVNGYYYSSTDGPRGLIPSGSILWTSDLDTSSSGWKLCPGDEASVSTQAPTSAPGEDEDEDEWWDDEDEDEWDDDWETALAPDWDKISTSSPTPWQSGQMFRVAYGECRVDASGCASSPNYPDVYGNNQQCILDVNNPNMQALSVSAFSTEMTYDSLSVNGILYTGAAGPGGIVPSGRIFWFADESETASGWKICPPVAGHGAVQVQTASTANAVAEFQVPDDEENGFGFILKILGILALGAMCACLAYRRCNKSADADMGGSGRSSYYGRSYDNL